MQAQPDYDPQNPGETEVFGMDFVNELSVGETIVSASVTLQVVTGTDATPQTHVNGSATISLSKVSQSIGGLLVNVTYRVIFTVVTNKGQTIILYSHVRCVPIT